jgi:hypothetical protein
MGYYVSITSAHFVIKKKNLTHAYKAMCALNDIDSLKGGGSWSGGEKKERWFAWMPKDYPDQYKTAQEIFENLGFDCDVLSSGDLIITGYDSKIGDEALFVEACSQFVEDDCYITWQGEEYESYQWRFVDGKMKVLEGTIVFS